MTFPLLGWFRSLSRRVRLALLVAAGLLVLYAVAGFLLVPAIVKSQVVRQARGRLNREATLAKVRYNPFTLEARLVGFDLRDRDGTPLLAFDTLVVNFSAASLPRRALVLDEFRLVRPAVVARIRPDGQLAVADLMKPDTLAPAPEPGRPSRPARLVVHRLAIRDGGLDFVDESRSPRYEEQFRQLGLEVEGLSTLPNEAGDHVLTANFATGAQLRWSGNNTVQPIDLSGEFQLSRLSLTRLGGVLAGGKPLRVTGGLGEGRLQYRVRQAENGQLTFTVPSASIAATDLVIQPSDLDQDWVRVRSLELQGIQAEWPARRASLERIRVVAPEIAARRLSDGTVDWASRLAAMQPDSAAPADTAPPWAITVASVDIEEGSVRVTDESAQPAAAFALTSISARAAPVGTDSTVSTALEFSATTGAGGSIGAKGQVVRAPLAADLDLTAEGLDLRQLRPYLGANPPAILEGGRMAAAGKLVVRDARPRSTFTGRAAITGFALNDTTGDSLIAWRAMRLERIRFTREPTLLRINRVVFERPFARIAIARDKTVNLMPLATMLPETPPEDRTPYEIGEVVLRDAVIDFSDESLILPFRTRIDSTHGTIRDLASFGGTPAALELEGKIEQYGVARANGSLHVGDPFVATTIHADFQNVSMPTLTPYSAQFAGYAISKGRMDVDVDYSIQNRILSADHKIVMTDLTLGEKVEGGAAPGFLVKLAVSLLKDDQGRITIDAPVEGSVDDPKFNYGAMVWDAVKTILARVATAPFRFLGNLLGIGGEDVELVDFDPGRSDVIPPEREKLDSLAAELGRKPDLLLVVEGRYDSVSDAGAMREAKLAALIQAERDSMGGKAQSDTSTTMLARILDRLYAERFSRDSLEALRDGFEAAQKADTARGSGKFDPAPYYAEVRSRLLADQAIEPGALERLGAERGAAIAAALTEGGRLDSTRVTVAEPAPVTRKKQGSSRVASEMAMDSK